MMADAIARRPAHELAPAINWQRLEGEAEAFVFDRLGVRGMLPQQETKIVSRLPALMLKAAKATDVSNSKPLRSPMQCAS